LTFTQIVIDDFHMLLESGKLIASAVDAIPAESCGAQPEGLETPRSAASLLNQAEWPQALAAQGVNAHGLAPGRLINGN
jgi:hypothetical protein